MYLKTELEKRGFLKQYTHEEVFDLYDSGGQTLYVGTDPTADSLHLGHFVFFMHAVQYMKRGNKLIVIVGGATGMVGDPSGKTTERIFLDRKTLEHNVESITKQVGVILEHLTKLSGYHFSYEVRNNLEMYDDMSYIHFLREVGKYITINQMINKDIVKRRIQNPDDSISYTEFSYMLMQGYDFLTLYQSDSCKLQIAGSDQRGNIVTGVELIRKKLDQTAYGITYPLLLDSSGKKFGKSEGNALRLDPQKNTPYEIYQYFLNTSDEDVERFLKILTLLSLDEINDIVVQHHQDPGFRYGQKQLANYVVTTIFGELASQQAQQVTQALFSKNNIIDVLATMDQETQDMLWKATGSVVLAPSTYNIVELLVEVGLASSNSEAKKLIKSSAISIQGTKTSNIGEEVVHDTSTHIGGTIIQKGKKKVVYIK